MDRPDTFYLAYAAASQLRSPLDGLACSTKSDDPLMGSNVGSVAGVLLGCFGNLDTLALPVPSGLVVHSQASPFYVRVDWICKDWPALQYEALSALTRGQAFCADKPQP